MKEKEAPDWGEVIVLIGVAVILACYGLSMLLAAISMVFN